MELRKKMTGGRLLAILFVFLSLAMLLPATAYAAEVDTPDNFRWNGSTLTWDECFEYNSFGAAYVCEYDVAILGEDSSGTQVTLKTYPRQSATSVDITSFLADGNTGRPIKVSVRAYGSTYLSTSETAYTEPIVFRIISFETDGGSPVPAVQYAAEGNPVLRPATDPAKANSFFSGWYQESSCENLWRFSSGVVGESDITLYAGWVAQGAHVHDGITYKPWGNDDSLPYQTGNYYLMQDVSLAGGWTVPSGQVILCLNGCDINGGGNPITIGNGSTLDIYDATQEPGSITGFSKTAIKIADGGTLRLHQGKITGNHMNYDDPANYRNGGGVTLNGGVFEMFGGEISSNRTKTDGGAMCIQDGTFRMRGGQISGNEASGGGGGIYLVGGSIEISGGVITRNKNEGLYASSTLSVNNVKIINAEGKNTTDLITITGNTGGDLLMGFTSTGTSYDYSPLDIAGTLSEDSRLGFDVYHTIGPGDGQPFTITTGSSANNASVDNFICNRDGAVIVVDGQEFQMRVLHGVAFDGNGAEGSMESDTVIDGYDYELPDNGFSVPKGYTFGGWQIGSDNKQAGESYKVNSNITPKAIWTAIDYSISCDLGGGSLPEGASNPETYTIATDEITLTNPERVGYNFLGWIGTDLDEPTMRVVIPKGSTGARTYTAVWDAIEYTLSYKLYGGTFTEGQENPSTYTIEDQIKLNNPIRDRSAFAGWLLVGSDEDETLEMVIPKGSTGNKTFLALWNVGYGVQVVDGIEHGTVSVDKTNVIAGDTVTIEVVPDDKYRLLSGSLKATNTSGTEIPITNNTFTMPPDDVTVSAEFTPILVSSVQLVGFESIHQKDLDEGATYQFRANASPSGALNKTLEWSIDDPSIATVDQNGLVTALKGGSTIMTVQAADGGGANTDLIIAVKHTHITKVDAKEATCEESGNIEHWKCDFETCGALFSDAEGKSAVAVDDVTIPALNHDWSEPVYTWGEDNTTLTASRTCKNDTANTHSQEEQVAVTSKVTKTPTCTEKGETTYTSAAFTNEAFASLTKTEQDIPIDPNAHAWDAGVTTKEATAKADGEQTYTCTICGATRTEAIPATGYEPGINPNKMGEDGTPGDKGTSAAAVEEALTTMKSDGDLQGSKFAPLKLKSTKQGKNSVKLSWKKAPGAVTYVIYGNQCGSKYKLAKIATQKGTSLNVKKLANKKKLAKGKYYKFVVMALDDSNCVVSTSKLIHVGTKGSKAGNYKKVMVKGSVLKKAKKLKKGKTLALKAAAFGKNVKTHAKVRYESSNEEIATVSSAGKVKAMAKGTCYVYCYAQNGICKQVKVTVK